MLAATYINIKQEFNGFKKKQKKQKQKVDKLKSMFETRNVKDSNSVTDPDRESIQSNIW